jgi:glycosyltransferase involved in cell wall biosynthesis
MRRKGLDLLLAAWGSLPEVHDQANRRLLLVGTGPDAPELRAQLTDPVFGNVVWIDRYLLDKARLADLLSAADVYAFPSRLEGFAVAPLEAMAAGLPVVAAAAPGVRELLPHGRKSGGVVVAVDDAPALAAAIAELLNEPDERLRLGARARRRAEDAFSVDAIGRRLRRVILQEP